MIKNCLLIFLILIYSIPIPEDDTHLPMKEQGNDSTKKDKYDKELLKGDGKKDDDKEKDDDKSSEDN